MSQRTQMRLHAITGSLTQIHTESTSSVAAAPASIAADNLLDVLGEFAGAIKRIHGADAFTNQAAGNFSHALTGSAGLKLAGDLDVNSSADIQGAVNMQSTLGVTGIATFSAAITGSAGADISGGETKLSSATISDLTSGRVVLAGAAGSIEDSANLTFNGSQLKVEGAVSGSGNFTVGGNLEVNGSATIASNLTIEAGADLIVQDLTAGRVVFVGSSDELVDDAEMTYAAGILTVSGSTISKDTTIARDLTVTRNLSAVSGSFSGDVTITGDLTINGTTTTVNTTELLVEDNMVVINKNESGAGVTAGTAGIEIERGSLDNAIVQWVEATDKFELKVGAAYADLKANDIAGSAATFSGALNADGQVDLAAASVATNVHGTLTVTEAATFNGLVDVNAGLSASFIKIDSDVATRLYIVDADGSMKDEANLTYNGSKLEVVGGISGSGNFQAGGSLDVLLGSDLHGAVRAYDTLRVDGAADLKQTLWVTGAVDMLSTLNLAQAGDQSILKTGGDLYVSASSDLRLQAGGVVKLVDQYRAASTWSDAEGIKLAASSAEWSNFKATFGGEVSLLAALTGGGSGGKFKAEIASTNAFVTASILNDVAGGDDFASKWASIVEPKIAKVDVFVNGQLMVSGSGMDYTVASNGDITFGFDLVADDIVMALVR